MFNTLMHAHPQLACHGWDERAADRSLASHLENPDKGSHALMRALMLAKGSDC